MGVHQRARHEEELKEHYIKKTSCIMLVLGALLVGVFIGNAITMVYVGRQQTPASSPSVQQQQSGSQADTQTLSRLENAANANPTNADLWVKLGNYCFDNGLPQKAIGAYERALELSPMRAAVWSDLGVMYRQTGQFQKALEALGQSAKIDPVHVTSRFNMGIIYRYDLNDKVNALKAWKDVLAINPNAKTPNGEPLAKVVSDLEKE